MTPTKADHRPRRAGLIAAGVLMASSVVLADPVVRSADLRIIVTSPRSCDVTMVLAIDGGGDIDHRIEAFEGTHIELAAVRGARHVNGVRTIGRTHSLVLQPEAGSYEFSYHAVQPADREYRCPIWLPAVPTDGRSRAVRLEVDLPVTATPAASMPAFTWTGAHGTTALGHIPAIVRIPYASPGEARGWGINSIIDALAIAVFAGATAIWTWLARR
jgi:hypothetical protein